MNIALLSPSQNSYSETFVQAHRKLEGNVFYFYDGEIPKKVEGRKGNKLESLIFRIYFRALKYIFGGEHLYDHFILKRNLKKLKVDVGLAEYGTTGAYCYSVFQQLKIPLIVHFHGYDASLERVVNEFRARYKPMFLYSSAIIAVSEEMKSDLIALGAHPNKIYVNPCGPADFFLTANNRPVEPLTFLHVGRFTEKKAPANTIMAFALCLKKYPSIKLFMVGDGDLLEPCKELVDSLGIGDNVSFLGKKSPKEVMEIMKHTFAFTLHSVRGSDGDKEGTPVSILEAMAVGLPVISTKHAGIKDVVNRNLTGYLVEEHDVDAMADCMLELLNDREKASEFGKRAKKKISEEYTLEQHLDGINRLLQMAVKK